MHRIWTSQQIRTNIGFFSLTFLPVFLPSSLFCSRFLAFPSFCYVLLFWDPLIYIYNYCYMIIIIYIYIFIHIHICWINPYTLYNILYNIIYVYWIYIFVLDVLGVWPCPQFGSDHPSRLRGSCGSCGSTHTRWPGLPRRQRCPSGSCETSIHRHLKFQWT